MNKEINHSSVEELRAAEIKKELDSMSPENRKALRRHFNQKMEDYDPGGKKAHEITQKYGQKKESSG